MIAKEDLVVGAQFKIVDAWDEKFYSKKEIEDLNGATRYSKWLGQTVTVRTVESRNDKYGAIVRVDENTCLWYLVDLEELYEQEEIEFDDACAMSALFGLT